MSRDHATALGIASLHSSLATEQDLVSKNTKKEKNVRTQRNTHIHIHTLGKYIQSIYYTVKPSGAFPSKSVNKVSERTKNCRSQIIKVQILDF